MKFNLKNIPALWKMIGAYWLLIAALVLFFDRHCFFSWQLWHTAFYSLGLFSLLSIIRKKINSKWFSVINLIGCYSLMTFFYQQTAYTNSLIFSKIDKALIRADQWLFGLQPSLEFSSRFSSCFFNELFNFGYFSYYLMPVIIVFFLFKYKSQKIDEFGFVLITSFLIYYVLFIFFPAVGPLFYYQYPHNHIQPCGFFSNSIELIQRVGEVPTGAFPSSHVGVCLILIIWLAKNYKRLVKFFISVALILIFSTVYVKAHYAVDAIAGIISAPLVYRASIASTNLYTRKTNQRFSFLKL